MYRKAELIDAIDELNDGKHTMQNIERLASVYTVLDHMDKEYRLDNDRGYSYDSPPVEVPNTIGNYGKSEFLQIITGRNQREVLLIIDEVMDALKVMNPKLYINAIDRLEG